MPDWLVAAILGFIEGLTEFIPVSSTGHLLIADHFLPQNTAAFLKSDLFNIVIQSGAVLAVIPLFSDRLRGFMHWRNPAHRDLLTKVIVAFGITGAAGVILD